jgi:outer membrane protein assembly factor BamA
MFLDIGNIWTFRYDEGREGGQFRFNSFLDDLAVGTGLGLRFDLKFVLLRADLGLKLRDPALTGGTKWIPFSGEYSNSEDEKKVWQVVIGIGYPF